MSGEAELDLDAAMLELTLDIVAATLLGGSLAGRADLLVDAVMTALHVVVAKAQQPIPDPGVVADTGSPSFPSVDEGARRGGR